jgi:putative transposase
MRDLLLLAIHLFVTTSKLLRPGGVRALAAESLLLKQQLIVSNRSRQRAPNLTTVDRFLLALIALFVRPRRIPKLCAIVKPATVLKFHKALVERKYRLLFSSCGRPRKPGPKGPSSEIIASIVEMKRRNPKLGYMKIALQMSIAFGFDIDNDVVRRVLAKHYRPGDSGSGGPSWLTFIAQSKDSLWSVDLFRCESILLRSFWVMVVMDVFTRRIIGLVSSVPTLMAYPCVECSTTRSLASNYQDTSARITIRSFAFIGGWRICAYSPLTRSSRFRVFLCRIHSLKG